MSEQPPYRPDPLADGFRVEPIEQLDRLAPVALQPPDPHHDRHRSFPGPEPTPAATPTPTPTPPTPSLQPAQRIPLPRRRRRGGAVALVAFLALGGLGAVSSVVTGVTGTADSPTAQRDSRVPIQGQPVEPVANDRILAPPVDASTMRFEVDGQGRTPTIRIYGGDDTEEQEAVSLPFAVERPVPERGSYLVSVTDYESEGGAPPMQCRIYVDDVLVALSTGYRSITCDLSVSQLPRSDDGSN